MNETQTKGWVADLIEFYDFIWEQGTEICGYHMNEMLIEDFRTGGPLFQEMVKKIQERFPTEASAREAMRFFMLSEALSKRIRQWRG